MIFITHTRKKSNFAALSIRNYISSLNYEKITTEVNDIINQYNLYISAVFNNAALSEEVLLKVIYCLLLY